MSLTTRLEKTSLEAHVDLCAIRYGNLAVRLTNIENKVSAIQTTIETSHLNTIKIMLGTAGTIIAGMISTIFIILEKVH